MYVLSHFVLFPIAFIAVGLAPGYVLARLLLRGRYSRAESAIFSLPFSLALAGIVATFISLTGLPFTTWTYLAAVILIVVIAARFRAPAEGAAASSTLLEILPFVSGAYVVAVLLIGFHGSNVPPDNADASSHCLLIAQILKKKSVLPAVVYGDWYMPHNEGHFYPYALHALIAVTIPFTRLPIYEHALYVTIVSSGFIVCGIYLFVKELSADPLAGACASILLASFYLFPIHPYAWGGWGLEAGFSLVLPTVALCSRVLESRRVDVRLAVAAGVLAVGVLYAHTTEIITIALMVAVVAGCKAVARRTIPRDWLVNTALAALAAAVLFAPYEIFALKQLSGGGTAEAQRLVVTAQPAVGLLAVARDLRHEVTQLYSEVFGMNGNLLATILLSIGILAVLWKRRGFEYLLVLAIYFGFIFLSLHPVALVHFMRVTFPWSQEQRLACVVILMAAALAGVGCASVLQLAFALRRPTARWAAGGLAAAALAAGFVAPTAYAIQALHWSWSNLASVGDDDMKAMAWMRDNVPPDVVVLNDGVQDGGVWIPVVAGREILLSNGTATRDDYSDRTYLLHNIGSVDWDRRMQGLLRQYNVGYVFYGSQVHVHGQRELNLIDLMGSRSLKLVFASGKAYVFKYDPVGERGSPSKVEVEVADWQNLDGFYPPQVWGDYVPPLRIRWTNGRGRIHLGVVDTTRIRRLEVRLFAPAVEHIRALRGDTAIGVTTVAGSSDWKTAIVNLSGGKGPLVLEVESPAPMKVPNDARTLGAAVSTVALIRYDEP